MKIGIFGGSFNPPHKMHENIAVKLIEDKYNNLSVDNHEMVTNDTYTIETLDYFKNEYPKDDIYFICGTDNPTYMDRWKMVIVF